MSVWSPEVIIDNTVAIPVDGSAVTQPVSAVALPLPTGRRHQCSGSCPHQTIRHSTGRRIGPHPTHFSHHAPPPYRSSDKRGCSCAYETV